MFIVVKFKNIDEKKNIDSFYLEVIILIYFFMVLFIYLYVICVYIYFFKTKSCWF